MWCSGKGYWCHWYTFSRYFKFLSQFLHTNSPSPLPSLSLFPYLPLDTEFALVYSARKLILDMWNGPCRASVGAWRLGKSSCGGGVLNLSLRCGPPLTTHVCLLFGGERPLVEWIMLENFEDSNQGLTHSCMLSVIIGHISSGLNDKLLQSATYSAFGYYKIWMGVKHGTNGWCKRVSVYQS